MYTNTSGVISKIVRSSHSDPFWMQPVIGRGLFLKRIDDLHAGDAPARLQVFREQHRAISPLGHLDNHGIPERQLMLDAQPRG